MPKHLNRTSAILPLVACLVLVIACMVAVAKQATIQSYFSRNYQCKDPQYQSRIISHDPLMIHYENIITEQERSHLLHLATPFLKRATVEFQNGSRQETTTRTSSVASLNSTEKDPILTCLVGRLARLQNNMPISSVERLQVTAYQPGQHYGLHLDSLGDTSKNSDDAWKRTTTYFGTLLCVSHTHYFYSSLFLLLTLYYTDVPLRNLSILPLMPPVLLLT